MEAKRRKILGTWSKDKYFPDELIFGEILCKLPLKSLIKFKLVSKKWDRFISSRKFAQTHFLLHSTVEDDCFLMLTRDHRCYSLSYDENKLKKLDLLHNNLANLMGRSSADIVGSCNGLVCLYSYEGIDGYELPFGTGLFALWNPATRDFRKINPPGEYIAPQARGFGYASEHNDYKIFGCSTVINSYHPYIGVFSSRTGEWKPLMEVDVDIDVFGGVTDPMGALVDGCLHWLLEDTGFDDDIMFLVFDFNTELLTYIPVLNSAMGYAQADLTVVKRCLSLCIWERFTGVTNFFMLKRQGNCFSSEKLYSFSSHRIRSLGFTQTSKRLINHNGQLHLVDSAEADRGLSQGIAFDGHIRTVTHHVYSLFSPVGKASYST